jgi:D-threo-aldose 1-dehydrogenase
MPRITTHRPLGRTNLRLPTIGFGAGSLGEILERITESEADATLEATWDTGVRYYDTAPWYGRGLSELRVGRLLRQKSRSDFVLSTKVGRTFHRPQDPSNFRGEFWRGGLSFEHRFDYSYDGIMRSYDQSLMRLGVNQIDILLIHDLDVSVLRSVDLVDMHLRELERSGWRALEILRHFREVTAIGAGVNVLGAIPQFLERFDVDCFLVAMPFTLLDQSASREEFPRCAERKVGIIVGSPFASGILATGTRIANPYYNYAKADADVIARARRIEEACEEFAIPLPAAALQFPLLNPIVSSVIPGSATARQAMENARFADVEIPSDFWESLKDRELVERTAY